MLVGSTRWANCLVTKTFEDLENDAKLEGSLSQSSVLQVLIRLWNGWFGGHMRDVASDAGTDLDRTRLAAPGSFELQVALLTDLHQLTYEQTAKIFGTSVETICNACQLVRSATLPDGTTVLVIEDDLLVSHALKKQIEGMGLRCSCVVATHPIDSVLSMNPDLIINGFATVSAPKVLAKDHDRAVPIPIIHLTRQTELLLTDTNYDPEFVLSKSYTPPQLDVLVKRIMQWSPRNNSRYRTKEP